jgi:hypothetical protein
VLTLSRPRRRGRLERLARTRNGTSRGPATISARTSAEDSNHAPHIIHVARRQPRARTRAEPHSAPHIEQHTAPHHEQHNTQHNAPHNTPTNFPHHLCERLVSAPQAVLPESVTPNGAAGALWSRASFVGLRRLALSATRRRRGGRRLARGCAVCARAAGPGRSSGRARCSGSCRHRSMSATQTGACGRSAS